MSVCQYCGSLSADAVYVYRCEFFNSYKWNIYLFCLKCMGNIEKLDYNDGNSRLAVKKKNTYVSKFSLKHHRIDSEREAAEHASCNRLPFTEWHSAIGCALLEMCTLVKNQLNTHTCDFTVFKSRGTAVGNIISWHGDRKQQFVSLLPRLTGKLRTQPHLSLSGWRKKKNHSLGSRVFCNLSQPPLNLLHCMKKD